MDGVSSSESLLLRLMEAAELRARVVSANIANQNTPGYTRQDVDFESVLRAALSSGSRVDALQPRIVEDTLSPARPDGNNVNLELELNALRENRLMFETYASILESRSNLKNIAVTEGR
jgi:flagellar basal-body rod protein FlgB